METSTATTTNTSTYEIGENPFGSGFVVLVNGLFLRDSANTVRTFKTRNSARKRIARERSGNFHR